MKIIKTNNYIKKEAQQFSDNMDLYDEHESKPSGVCSVCGEAIIPEQRVSCDICGKIVHEPNRLDHDPCMVRCEVCKIPACKTCMEPTADGWFCGDEHKQQFYKNNIG